MSYKSSASYHGDGKLIPLEYYPTRFDIWNREYERLYKALYNILQCALEDLDILYVGCGRRLPFEDLVAIDLDPNVGEGMKDFRCMDVENLEFEDNSFHVVLSSHTIEHLNDQLKGLQEQCRVVKSGGLVGAIIPDVTWTAGLDPTHTREWKMQEFVDIFSVVGDMKIVAFGSAEYEYSFYVVWQKLSEVK